MSEPTTVLVMAKAPVAGRVKTRLCPPCDPEQAARIAEAALVDTLEAVARSGADRFVIALDGEPGPWLPPGFEVIPQIQGSFAARLAAAWSAVAGPTLQVGMDTPQLGPTWIDDGLGRVATGGAVLGPAHDGGWWAIGMAGPGPDVFTGVEMSRPDTGAQQLRAMRRHGLDPQLLPALRDIDTAADARLVASEMPGSRTAAAVDAVLGVRS